MNAKNVMKFLATLIVGMMLTTFAAAQDMHKSSNFQGPKANKGSVTHSDRDGKSVLTLSDDFVVPDTPDPHWRVVDSDGNVYPGAAEICDDKDSDCDGLSADRTDGDGDGQTVCDGDCALCCACA